MLRTTVASAAIAAVCAALGGALAAPLAGGPGGPGHAAAERVQYRSDWRGPRDIEEHRWLHREQLRAYEEERVAEAARREAKREAKRVEAERGAERRAWWDAARRERPWRHNGF
jgi:hypothetical protein